MYRVRMILRGLPQGPLEKMVTIENAKLWLDMVGKQVKLNDGNRLFISSAQATFDPLNLELDSIDVQVTVNP